MGVTKYSMEFRAELLKKFEDYIENIESPLIKEFAILNGIPKANLYEFTEFVDYLKKAKDKTEIWRIRQIESGKNIIGQMFLLKAMYGYRDSTPIQIDTGDTQHLTINFKGKSKDDLIDIATKQLRGIKADRVTKTK